MLQWLSSWGAGHMVGAERGGHLCAGTSRQVNAHLWRGLGAGSEPSSLRLCQAQRRQRAEQVRQVEPAQRSCRASADIRSIQGPSLTHRAGSIPCHCTRSPQGRRDVLLKATFPLLEPAEDPRADQGALIVCGTFARARTGIRTLVSKASRNRNQIGPTQHQCLHHRPEPWDSRTWGVPLVITVAAVVLKKIGYDASDVSVGWCWIDLEAKDPVLWMLLTGKLWEMLAYILLPLLVPPGPEAHQQSGRRCPQNSGPSSWPLCPGAGPGVEFDHPRGQAASLGTEPVMGRRGPGT
ncbi:hypothetical protein H8959_017095 [Pygathrix nigripes]